MAFENKQLFTIDNAGGHNLTEQLNNTVLEYVYHNVTSHIQPCDIGILNY